MILIFQEDPETPDAAELIDELSDILQAITGRSGRSSFDPSDVRVPRSLFVIARDENGAALGCGAFRPMSEKTAEVKRMYSRDVRKGVGKAILLYIEDKARSFGYESLLIETGVENLAAVSFYENMGYKVIPNFGKYEGKINSVCFGKRL